MIQTSASDRKSVRAAEKAAALADRQRGETVIQLMSTAPGRRFVWEKLGSAHIFQTSFNIDSIQMAFNEGERNQGLLLLNDIIQWCPEQFILAMRESNERRDAGQLSGSSNGDGRDQGSTDDTASGLGEYGTDEDSDRDEASLN